MQLVIAEKPSVAQNVRMDTWRAMITSCHGVWDI